MPGDGKWYARIQGARADTPATIGQHYDLVGDLSTLPICFSSNDYPQHIAVLWFDIPGGRRLEQLRQYFTWLNLSSLYSNGFGASKSQADQELHVRDEIRGEAHFERDGAETLTSEGE